MQDMMPPEFPTWIPAPLRSIFVELGGLFFLAWLGRMMHHVRLVQMRKRRFWALHLVWEIFTALAIGLIADGVASYMGLTGKPATALVIVVAYLGPGGLEAGVLWMAERYAPPRY
jgi:hypothetical protein